MYLYVELVVAALAFSMKIGDIIAIIMNDAAIRPTIDGNLFLLIT